MSSVPIVMGVPGQGPATFLWVGVVMLTVGIVMIVVGKRLRRRHLS